MQAQLVDSPDLLVLRTPQQPSNHHQVMSPNPCSSQSSASTSIQQQRQLQQHQQQQQPSETTLLLRQLTELRLPTGLLEQMRTTGISVQEYHGTMDALQNGLAFIAQQLYERTNVLGGNLTAQAGRSEILGQMMQHIDAQLRTRQQWEQSFQQSVQSGLNDVVTRLEESIATLKATTIAEVFAKQSAMQTSLTEIASQVERLRGVEQLQSQINELRRSMEEREQMYERIRFALDSEGQTASSEVVRAVDAHTSSIQDLTSRSAALEVSCAESEVTINKLQHQLREQAAEIAWLKEALKSRTDKEPEHAGSPVRSAHMSVRPTQGHFLMTPDAGTPGFGGSNATSLTQEAARQQQWNEDDWWGLPSGGVFGQNMPPPPELPPCLSKPAHDAQHQTGTESAASGADNASASAEKVPEGKWKMLKDVPTLQVGSSSPWEAGMNLFSWQAQLRTICGSISVAFGVYVDSCWHEAQRLYTEQMASRTKAKPPAVDPRFAEWDGRLTATLLRIVPEELKQPVIEEAQGLTISATAICLAVLTRLQPGGSEEITSLQRFLRSPTVPNTVSELAKVLRRYQLALSRSRHLSLPELAPPEGLRAVLSLARQVERKYGSLQMRMSILRLDPATSTRPTHAGVQSVLEMLDRECIELLADEQSKNTAITADPFVAAASAETARKPCHFYGTAQGCRRGKDCPFAHEESGKGKGQGNDKGKGKGKDKGKKGKGISQASQVEAPSKPEPMPKPKPKPKADAKAKATAQKLLGGDEGGANASMARSTVDKVASYPYPSTDASPEWVLLDSGANEVCRPLDASADYSNRDRFIPLDVTLASGRVTTGYRSIRDGEIYMEMEGADWIAGMSKLVGAGFTFEWSQHGPKLISENTKPIEVCLRNGLPYIRWQDFKRARTRMSKVHRQAAGTEQGRPWNAIQEEPPLVLLNGVIASAADATASNASAVKDQAQQATSRISTTLPRSSHQHLTEDITLPETPNVEKAVELQEEGNRQGWGVQVRPVIVEPGLDEHPMPVVRRDTVADRVVEVSDDEAVPGEINDAGFGSEEGGDSELRAKLKNAMEPALSEPLPVSSAFEEVAREQRMKDMLKACQRGLYESGCDACVGSRGLRRAFRRLKPTEVAAGCLGLDISGPHTNTPDGTRYALIATLTLPSGESLPFVAPLGTRKSKEVLEQVLGIMARITSMSGGKPSIFRVHSDNAAELVSDKFDQQMKDLGLFRTTTVPYSPQSNGRTERMIDQLKLETAIYLLHGKLSPKLWFYCLSEAAMTRRSKILKLKIPKGAPKPGDHVLIKRQGAKAFEDKTIPALYLSADDNTVGGSWVMYLDQANSVITRARLPLLSETVKTRWRCMSTPQGDRLWVSTMGEITFEDVPDDSEILTLEERVQGPPSAERNRVRATLMKNLYVGTQDELTEADQVGEFVRFAHGFLGAGLELDSGEHDGDDHKAKHLEEADYSPSDVDPQAAEDHDGGGPEVRATRVDQSAETYHVPPYHVEDASLEDELKAIQEGLKTSAEEVDNHVFTSPGCEKWIQAAKDEVQKLRDMQVWREVPKDQLRSVLGLGAKDPLPKILPSRTVNTKKPLLMPEDMMKVSAGARHAQQTESDESFLARVRMVGCGNFQSKAGEMTGENSSNNVQGEALRMMFSILGNKPDWSGMSLDVSSAFLYAKLRSSQTILVAPPAIFIKMGIMDANTVLILDKALYGLREAPVDWEIERDETVASLPLEPEKADSLGKLQCVPISGYKGFWKVIEVKSGALVAVMSMYVDDEWLIGLPEALRRITAALRGLWKLKVQGVLEHADVIPDKDGLWHDIPVRKELVFLGMQISRTVTGGVKVSQRRWILQELMKRGWAGLNGCKTLPDHNAGKITKEVDIKPEDIRKAQSEVGSLMYCALRTRPDVASTVSAAACVLTRNPIEAIRICKHTWRYLKGTIDMSLTFEPSDEPWNLKVYSDASFSPEGGRSRTGIAISLNRSLLYWRSCRQQLTAWSATEAELEAMTEALCVALKLKHTLEEVLNVSMLVVQRGDNQGAITLALRDNHSWLAMRTRHYALRLSWLRDMLHTYAVDLQHMASGELPADILTKSLSRIKLEAGRRLLGMSFSQDTSNT